VSTPEPSQALNIFETHAHLQHEKFAADLPDVLARAREAGVREIMLIGADLPSSRDAVRLAEAHAGLFATVGIHPHDASTWNAAAERELRELARSPKVRAIGEIGLDFYRDLSPRDLQYTAFRAQLDLARELGFPVVIHTRDSMDAALDVLEPAGRGGMKVLLHCWSGSVEQARRACGFGALLGIGGVVTYKNAGDLPEVARQIPLEHLVLETDCPYLTPMPHRGKRNEPGYLPLVVRRMAELRGEEAAEVARQTREAGLGFFGLPDSTRGA
jgi:TatD DNase family protein